MKYVKASSLDAHDRKRFNELLPNVSADNVVETEFDNFVNKVQATQWLRRAVIVGGLVPQLAVGARAASFRRTRG